MFVSISLTTHVMKEKIVKYFKTDRSHASGVALIMGLSNRLALKKQINIQPQSDYLTGVIHEELRELGGISPAEMKNILSVPVAKVIPQVAEASTEVKPQDPEPPAAPKATKAVKTPVAKKASRKK